MPLKQRSIRIKEEPQISGNFPQDKNFSSTNKRQMPVQLEGPYKLKFLPRATKLSREGAPYSEISPPGFSTPLSLIDLR